MHPLLHPLLSPSKNPYDPPPLLHTLLRHPLHLLLHLLDFTLSLLRPPPPKHPQRNPPIRLVCLSDTHSLTLPASEIPDGDILIHAGDLTNDGTPEAIQEQIDWLDALPGFEEGGKVVVAGNHDYFLDPRSRKFLAQGTEREGKVEWKSLHYLQNSGVTLRVRGREVRIFGAPQTACGVEYFAFQYPPGHDAWTGTIPHDVDVLVTHGPPKFLLDLPAALGDKFLLKEVRRVQPRVHVFGHVHAGRTDFIGGLRRGMVDVRWGRGREVLERGLRRGEEGGGGWWWVLDLRCWIDVVEVVGFGVLRVVRERVFGGGGGGGRGMTTFVNASLMFNNTGRLGNRAQVVEI